MYNMYLQITLRLMLKHRVYQCKVSLIRILY
nr:MAG TPA: hypothetical protein [Caudoviricetes sp.]